MRAGKRAYAVSLAAIWTALVVLMLHLGSLIPTGRWGMAALAGLLPAGAVISGGLFSGVLCWIGSSVLSFLLIPDKLLSMLFAVLFGLYPLVKNLVERIEKRWVEWFCKLLFFNCAVTILYVGMQAAVLHSLPAPVRGTGIFYLVGNVVFLLYDYGFSKLISLYMARVGRRGRH